MRSVLLVMLCVFSISCKKIVENVQRGIILDIVTNGQWYVESFAEESTDGTSQFSGYLFQFKDDNTVTASKGVQVQEGTWREDISDYSLNANFPNATVPLSKLNGKWIWKDSGDDFVVAEKTEGSVKYLLKLRKKP